MLSRGSLFLAFQRSRSRPLSVSFGVRFFSNDVSPGSRRAPLPSGTASALASGLPHDLRLLLLNTGLRHVKSHGWTLDALAAGADELGYVVFSSLLLHNCSALPARHPLVLSQPPSVVHRYFLPGSRGISLAYNEPCDGRHGDRAVEYELISRACRGSYRAWTAHAPRYLRPVPSDVGWRHGSRRVSARVT